MGSQAFMTIAQSVIGAISIGPVDGTGTRPKEEDPRAEIAAEQQLLDRLRLAGSLPASDLAESLPKSLRIACDARVDRRPEYPGRIVGIELADGDLMEEVGKARGISGVGACPPDLPDETAQRIRLGE